MDKAENVFEDRINTVQRTKTKLENVEKALEKQFEAMKEIQDILKTAETKLQTQLSKDENEINKLGEIMEIMASKISIEKQKLPADLNADDILSTKTENDKSRRNPSQSQKQNTEFNGGQEKPVTEINITTALKDIENARRIDKNIRDKISEDKKVSISEKQERDEVQDTTDKPQKNKLDTHQDKLLENQLHTIHQLRDKLQPVVEKLHNQLLHVEDEKRLTELKDTERKAKLQNQSENGKQGIQVSVNKNEEERDLEQNGENKQNEAHFEKKISVMPLSRNREQFSETQPSDIEHGDNEKRNSKLSTTNDESNNEEYEQGQNQLSDIENNKKITKAKHPLTKTVDEQKTINKSTLLKLQQRPTETTDRDHKSINNNEESLNENDYDLFPTKRADAMFKDADLLDEKLYHLETRESD